MDTHTVTVKLFAALRDAAEVSEVVLNGPLSPAEIIDELSARFGRKFAERVRIAAVMVNGDPVPADSSVPVIEGAEVALLPPFAGGA